MTSQREQRFVVLVSVFLVLCMVLLATTWECPSCGDALCLVRGVNGCHGRSIFVGPLAERITQVYDERETGKGIRP